MNRRELSAVRGRWLMRQHRAPNDCHTNPPQCRTNWVDRETNPAHCQTNWVDRQTNPAGFAAHSRWLRSAATIPPDARPPKRPSHPGRDASAVTSGWHVQHHAAIPAGIDRMVRRASGGIAALNPRLCAVIPVGMNAGQAEQAKFIANRQTSIHLRSRKRYGFYEQKIAKAAKWEAYKRQPLRTSVKQDYNQPRSICN